MIFEIWSEGFMTQGQQKPNPAIFFGKVEAETFKEACIEKFDRMRLFDVENMTYWGCKLFDNQEDARRKFG
mgnify:CR=1 FL=1